MIIERMNQKLTSENFIFYAMKNYDNPHCHGIEEFHEDLNRIKYIKRLFGIRKEWSNKRKTSSKSCNHTRQSFWK